MTDKKAAILVLGGGSWGTAFASRLSVENQLSVALWARNEKVVSDINLRHDNQRYLPECELSKNLLAFSDLEKAISFLLNEGHASFKIIIFALPASGFPDVCKRLLKLNINKKIVLLSLCKGLVSSADAEVFFPSQFLKQMLPNNELCVLSGPSFASEVGRGLPFAISCASQNQEMARVVSATFSTKRLRVYSTTDVTGVEVSGVMKNVIAIASGLCDGLELGFNARASLITRGMAETVRLGLALGAEGKTFLGLAGFGDLLLTTTGSLSRNKRVGYEIAKGADLKKILNNLGQVAEGVTTAPKVLCLGNSKKVSLPITAEICALLEGKKLISDAVDSLLSRNLSDE